MIAPPWFIALGELPTPFWENTGHARHFSCGSISSCPQMSSSCEDNPQAQRKNHSETLQMMAAMLRKVGGRCPVAISQQHSVTTVPGGSPGPAHPVLDNLALATTSAGSTVAGSAYVAEPW